MRRVDHGRDVVEVRKCPLEYLPDVEVIGIRGRHAEEIGRSDHATPRKLVVKILEELLQRLGLRHTAAPRCIRFRHRTVGRKTDIVEIDFVETDGV